MKSKLASSVKKIWHVIRFVSVLMIWCFTSLSILFQCYRMSERSKGDNKRFCAMMRRTIVSAFPTPAGLEPKDLVIQSRER